MYKERKCGEKEEWRRGEVGDEQLGRRAVGEKKTGTDMGVSGIQTGNGNAKC